jgi:endoglucanase
LGGLVGDPQDFASLAAGTRALVASVLAVDALPPNWVQLDGGQLTGRSPSGPSDNYGFDAVRLPVRWAASCDATDRRAAAALWPALGRAALRNRPSVDLPVTPGSAANPKGAVRSPVGLVAAAAAGLAAGHRHDALVLLGRADAMNRARPTYYSSAWVALGLILLETQRLGTCGGT